MTAPLKFHFPLGVLLQEADYILDAAEFDPDPIHDRVPGLIDDLRAKHALLRGRTSNQKFKTGDLGDLTREQNDAFAEMNRLVVAAKQAAKRAFAGHDVMLRNDFQVGMHSPGDLGSILTRAYIVRDSCANAENAPALAAEGWLAGDTAALTAAIEALDTTDDSQEDAKLTKKDSTAERNAVANQLYDGLLRLQGIANIQWPPNGNGHTLIRERFRLGLFPPKRRKKNGQNGNGNGNGGTPTPPPTPA